MYKSLEKIFNYLTAHPGEMWIDANQKKLYVLAGEREVKMHILHGDFVGMTDDELNAFVESKLVDG